MQTPAPETWHALNQRQLMAAVAATKGTSSADTPASVARETGPRALMLRPFRIRGTSSANSSVSATLSEAVAAGAGCSAALTCAKT